MLRYVTMHNISHAQTSAQSNEISYGRRLILFLYTLCPEKRTDSILAATLTNLDNFS